MMKIRFLAASALLTLAFAPAEAQNADVQSADMKNRVAELRAMSAADRKAALQAMSPEERKGLWFAIKQADWAARDTGTTESGFYRNAVSEAGSRKTDSAAKTRGAAGTKAVGTITYDDGVITTTFGGGAIIGNRFDTHTSVPVLASGTVSTVVGVLQPGGAVTNSSAFFVIEGPQTAGGGATAIFSSATTGLTAATETVTFTGIGANYTGSSFFVLFGDNANSYIPAFGTGTTNGQGHHGMVGYTGGQFPDITSTFDFGNTLNGLVRASGNILPVELIEYGVE